MQVRLAPSRSRALLGRQLNGWTGTCLGGRPGTEIWNFGSRQLGLVNGVRGTHDIEGKATRVGASECGQRTSFKTEAKLFYAESLRHDVIVR